MPNQTLSHQALSQWSSRLRRSETPTRRAGHGGIAWSNPVGAKTLRQPQDGAPETRSRVATITSRLNGSTLFEPEDATITGGTRSLNRRLMGLNVMREDRKSPGAISFVPAQTQVA